MSENDSCAGPRTTAGSPYPAEQADDGASVVVPGGHTGGRAAVVMRSLPAGATTLRRRLLGADLAYLVVEGTVELEVEGCGRELHALSVHQVPAGVVHRYRALTDARLLLVAVPAGVEQLLLHEERLALEDPELLLALAQEHRVDLLHGIP